MERELAKKEAEREFQQFRRATEEQLQQSFGKTLAPRRGATKAEIEENTREVSEFLSQPTHKARKRSVLVTVDGPDGGEGSSFDTESSGASS